VARYIRSTTLGHISEDRSPPRPLGRRRNIWESNIKMNFKERKLKGVDWINLVQDRDHWWALVNTVMILRVP
jgi:hypothetical protein